jgi:dephospho-CoA kinase
MDARIERLKGRGMQLSEIQKRIENQASTDQRKSISNIVIENDGNEEDLLRKS